MSKAIHHDPLADSYYTEIDGREVWSESSETLKNILHRLDEREARREDARATYVAILLATGLLAVAAVIAALIGGC
jgi:hypothetical protein